MSVREAIICTYPSIVKVSQLEKMIADKNEADKPILVSIIEHRLSRRFLKVIENAKEEDLSSFMSMAVCCLLIETLECFYLGWANTNRKGVKVFKNFFDRYTNEFPGFYEKSVDFYENVRCGLLHQAETYNGWFLVKRGEIYEQGQGVKTINGDKFVIATKNAIEIYLDLLRDKHLNDELWDNAFIKLKNVCDNCCER